MPVGKGVVIAIEGRVGRDQIMQLDAFWSEKMPDVPAIFVPEARIVLRDSQSVLFEFTGSTITPTFVAEFQKWWEEVQRG